MQDRRFAHAALNARGLPLQHIAWYELRRMQFEFCWDRGLLVDAERECRAAIALGEKGGAVSFVDILRRFGDEQHARTYAERMSRCILTVYEHCDRSMKSCLESVQRARRERKHGLAWDRGWHERMWREGTAMDAHARKLY